MPNLSDFMLAARDRESTDNYASQDSGTSFYGAYQFGTDAFITTGYIVAGSQEIVQQFNSEGIPYPVWTGQAEWTGKDGINSLEDWLDTSNPDITDIQDRAFLEWIYYQWSKIRGIDAEPLAGQTLNGIDLSVSGMVMASHLVGETAFRNNYISSGGTNSTADGNGKTEIDYLNLFADYDLSDLSGISSAVIPDTAGGVVTTGNPFASYFVDNHDQDNVFNRHDDDSVDVDPNSPGLNDFPMHLGTGDDKIFGFGGNDTVYGSAMLWRAHLAVEAL